MESVRERESMRVFWRVGWRKGLSTCEEGVAYDISVN